jgi:hypothetical protein
MVVSIRGVPVAARGQQFIAAVIVNGPAKIIAANLSINFDPTIFEVKAVRDGGLMRTGGVSVEPQVNTQPGVITVSIERPPESGPVVARGQLLYIILEARAVGQTAIALGEASTFRGPNGQQVIASFESAQVEVR